MKKLLLTLAVIAVAAAPAYAYVQAGHLPSPTASKPGAMSSGASVPQSVDLGAQLPPLPGDTRGGEHDGDETPTRPVPEPGTMALASMGLLALGVARRMRKR